MLDVLKTPITALLSVSVISSLLLHITSNSNQKSPLRLLCSLFVLLCVFNIISPFVKTVTSITFENDDAYTESHPESTDATDDAAITESAKYISKYTEDMITEKFDISADALSVSVTLSQGQDGEIFIKNATVEFSLALEIDYTEVAKTVSDTLLCECTVLKKE